MTLESRLSKLETALADSGERATVFGLLGINVFGHPPVDPYSDEDILPALQADPALCQCLGKMIGRDDLTAEEIAAEVITWRHEAAHVAADRPEGPQDAPGRAMPPDGPKMDPGPSRGREGQN